MPARRLLTIVGLALVVLGLLGHRIAKIDLGRRPNGARQLSHLSSGHDFAHDQRGTARAGSLING